MSSGGLQTRKDELGGIRPRRATIVCADDDAVVRMTLVAILGRAGHEVIAAEDGSGAIALTREHSPDLIILDLRMHGEDGFSTYEQLRELPGHATTPILFISGSESEEDVARGLNLGAVDYITKPIAPGVLRAKVEVFVERESRKGMTVSQTRAIATSPDEVQNACSLQDRVFDKYVLLDEVGSGRLGVVIRAWDSALRDYVALKFVRDGVTEEEVEQLYSEARNVMRLAHDHIVRVHDIREVGGRHFFAMQYIDGQPADRKYVPREAAAMVACIAGAVAHAHQKGIVHRDIKPENILVDEQGKPWITDFGISVAVDVDSGKLAHVPRAGSPSYMAPEQTGLIGEPVTHLADVFSLGATLYHMLTGTAPFRGTSTEDVLEAVVRGELVPPSVLERKLSSGIEGICLKAMKTDPAARYQSARELADALEGYCNSPSKRLRAWLFRS